MTRRLVLGMITGVLLLGTGLAWVGASQTTKQKLEPVSSHELSAYLDSLLVDFVRPGLTIKLDEPSVGSDRRIRVRVRITDPKGLPLDRAGVFTPGAISMSFVAAYLPSPDGQFTAYTTRSVTSPITRVTAVQASADTGGSFELLGDGLYRYTFGTVLPATYNPSLTHSIGVYGTRDLTEFRLDRQFSNDVIAFVPDASQPPHDRAITVTANCNNCHDPISAHGEVRQDLRLCVLCHTPQTIDPDTGNTVDMKVMIHKIHRGADLPSVRAGIPYRIIGFQQSVADFSTIEFPDDVRNCERCHQNAPHSTNYLTKPSRAACGACHDNVDFSTGANHAGIVQTSDTLCSTCHIPQGDKEFDVSIKGAHVVPTEAESLAGVVFEILGVDNARPGSRPTIRFRIRNKAGQPILPSLMSSLALVMAGPTSDYLSYVREDARSATGTGGEYSYTFNRAISADFQGSMAVGIEGYRNQTMLKADNTTITVRDAGFNKVFYFDTGGGTAQPRRAVVKLDGCNSCHGELAVHGGQRENTEYCVLCHNPVENDRVRRPADKSPPESVHFKTLIHRIHAGERQERDFTIYGFGGAAINFNELHFPGDLRNCVKCHFEGAQQLPLREGLQPTVSPRDLLNPMPPETAACLSCHTSRAAAVHAQLNASPLGEACAVCHGPQAEFSVDRVHAR